jgi:biotin carboxyl carrier protein
MRTYSLTIQGRSVTIAVREFSPKEATLEVDGETYKVRVDNVESDAKLRTVRALPKRSAAATAAAPVASKARAAGAGSVMAPIPAMILAVLVSEGQLVTTGQPLIKMEAMKMETVVSASAAGSVEAVLVKVGDAVTQGQELMVIV